MNASPVNAITQLSLENSGLRQELERLKATPPKWTEPFEAMRELVFTHGPDGEIMYANRAYCEHVDMQLGAILGRTYWQIFPKQPFPAPQVNASSGLAAEDIFDDGNSVFRLRRFLVDSADGSSAYVVNILEDFTDQRRVEQVLQEQLTLYQALLKAQSDVGEGMLIVEDSRVTYVNDAFCRMTGYAAPEIEALPSFLSLVHPDDRERVHGNHARRIAGEQFADRYQIGVITRIGERREVEIAVVAMHRDGKLGVVVVVIDITQQKRDEEKIRYLATHDPLTGLPNRALFVEKLSSMLKLAQRHQKKMAVFFIDLDRFKRINDTLGHLVGDRLLQLVANKFRSCLRETDTIARIGGDEFTVILHDIANAAEAEPVAKKIVSALSVPIHRLEGHELVVTPSIGISIYPDDGRDVETLLKHSDVAMYRAKSEGKNTYRFFSVEMNEHHLEHLLLENNLHSALDKEELLLHYQPKIDLLSGRMVGVEALMRWRHPDLGMISPEKFIPLAEECGLIIPIGEWALWHACKQNKAWQADGYMPIRMVVNLSAKQFHEKTLPDTVAKILAETGLAADYLELEVTESCVMCNPEDAIETLNALRQIGVHISIDDFGTGYSSMGYLKRFPIDAIKIDRSFVMGVPHDANDSAIAAAVISLGHSLGLRVIGEGVETQEQLAFLAAKGCDEIQGFLFAQPLAAELLKPIFQNLGLVEACEMV